MSQTPEWEPEKHWQVIGHGDVRHVPRMDKLKPNVSKLEEAQMLARYLMRTSSTVRGVTVQLVEVSG